MTVDFGDYCGKVDGYRLGRVLGFGSTATCRLCEKDGHYYAIKLFKKRTVRLEAELKSLLALDHPNIVKLIDYNL